MSTLRTVFTCVITACILFSCNNKKVKNNLAKTKNIASELSAINVLPDDLLLMDEFSKGFAGNAAERFTAPAKKLSVIKGAKGLKVTIDPAALEREDGTEVDGTINISILELTTADDLFKSNAATMCEGRLLASGGSYYIGMENNGQKLRIKKGRALQVNFPAITKDEMELFYGERDTEGNMNWKRAGVDLVPGKQESSVTFVNRTDVFAEMPAEPAIEMPKLTLYRSLYEKVYYYNKQMTVQELVDTLNRYSKKVFLETVYTWPKELDTLPPGTKVDTTFLLRKYGPPKQYYLKTYKSLEDEKARWARIAAWRDSVNRLRYTVSLTDQVQRYYQPSAISSLGWINCDRFYQNRQTDVELDIPITMNGSRIQFFLIFRSFNGMMNFNVDTVGIKRNIFRNLPDGQAVTIVGFSKVKGQLFQCRKDLIIRKDKPVAISFEKISQKEMTKMFGKNIKV